MRPWACCLGLQMSPCRVVTSADDGARSHYRSGRSIGFYGVLRMVRELFYTAALLVPGLAYAGNPSADLSVQIVPAVPQVPARPQALRRSQPTTTLANPSMPVSRTISPVGC